MLTKACTYGIQALVLLALEESSGFTPVSHIARKLDIPYHFLKKILRNLTEHGFLDSQRSAKGGVRLSKTADKISLADILDATEGRATLDTCLLNLADCSDARPCPLHDFWIAERQRLLDHLDKTSIGHMAEEAKARGLRLANLN